MIKDRQHWQGIWELFIKGDRDAFREIYNEFVDVLFAYGLKITHDHELVQDCIHELFINLYKYRQNLNRPEYLEFYLFKSLRRTVIYELKKEKQNTRVSEEGFLSFQLRFDLEDELIERESNEKRVNLIKEILAGLDSKKRELLYLKFYSGLNYREIGSLLDIKPDTAKKQVYRLLDDLRDNFSKKLMELLFLYIKA
jgi:RNA polymerase sigma factor (sigma-70 family)